MATSLQASGYLFSSPNPSKLCLIRAGKLTKASLNNVDPTSQGRNLSLRNLSSRGLVEELDLGKSYRGLPSGIIHKHVVSVDNTINSSSDSLVIEKLYAILEEISDRIEMHNNIKEQRENWNSLLLTSINSITLTAAIMSGISSTTTAAVGGLNFSSTLLYLAATGLLIMMNKLQPSQLVEEQRNAVRLFKQLQNQIQRIINIGNFTDQDVIEAMEKVLALDKAFPLPLLGGVMLEKFPADVQPAVWWPQQLPRQPKESALEMGKNGWNEKLEKQMNEIVKIIKRKDKSEYLNLGRKALKMNKILAVSGPLLTGLAAISSAHGGSMAAMIGVVAGSLASVVNAFEHGGQIGMIFEMYRNNAGFFKLMEETIESNLMERDFERRENGELVEMKVALQLGRSLSELRNLTSSSSFKLNQGDDMDEFASKFTGFPSSIIEKHAISIDENSLVKEKLYEILEAVSDRVEMHKNIGEQRDNWNSLLLNSINTITLAAATMSATSLVDDSSLSSLKWGSTLLYLAATGMLIIMNKIQPSQLVEEQRNATRLFKQLENQIQRIIGIGNPKESDVMEAMEKVLALDKAYPLPLLGVMLEKFPSSVEPAVWWPKQQRRQVVKDGNGNGWNWKLEKEMKKVVDVLRKRDKAEYMRLGEKALKLNKFLAISGPLLTGMAAVGSALMGSGSEHGGSWAAMLGIVGGALASVVNTIEHGGQVGMVFEMYRGNAGFFKLMEESIESNLMEKDLERRENGELFEMKVALQLGRSLSELRNLASDHSSSSHQDDDISQEFASKLF
ncbi:hypothetical protein M9H77_25543 [Catharanthus roseus]|uniref:Uncharacterized protein n=1 Tax=Catharanthus roseus TaxID=4058 RepID=A0ACC0A911_CATRO|nr:hypothetical protein M9H77_25543 [Catharanthus roseus]